MTITELGNEFGIEPIAIKTIDKGIINTSFLVMDKNKKRYIFQEISPIFNVEGVMHNIEKVTEHIKEKAKSQPVFMGSGSGGTLFSTLCFACGLPQRCGNRRRSLGHDSGLSGRNGRGNAELKNTSQKRQNVVYCLYRAFFALCRQKKSKRVYLKIL